MRSFIVSALFLVASCGDINNFQNNINAKTKEIRSQNTVTGMDALESLRKLNSSEPFNAAIFRQSVAQVVFPKIVKAGFFLGANYGEGFLIRDGEVIALIDLAGGNLGLQVGAQSYSQVTYILSEKRYHDLLSGNRMSLNGSVSFAVSGRIQNAIMTTDAIIGDLYTVHFNESGTVFGASIEGLHYTKRD